MPRNFGRLAAGASLALGAATLVGSCSDPTIGLTVVVRTDLVPGDEFAVARATVESAAGTTREDERAALATSDFLAGVAVADFEGLPSGRYRIRVRLLDSLGAVVVERTAVADARQTTAVTITITRSCALVRCPRPGDDARATECIGGRCEAPECVTPGTAGCAPGCAADTDCPAASACTLGRCEAGECLVEPLDGRCAAAERCDPVRGCVPATPLRDAGAPFDAGPALDGGASADAGAPCDPRACAAFGASCCPGRAACFALLSDPANCGACGMACWTGAACEYHSGVTAPFCTTCDAAACAAFGSVCCPGNGGCIAIFSDVENCGACENACSAGERCAFHAGVSRAFCTTCDSDACAMFGAACCPGTSECVAILSDPSNCGACGNRCAPSETCQFDGTRARCR